MPRFLAALLVFSFIASRALAQQDGLTHVNDNYFEQMVPRPNQVLDPSLAATGQSYWGFDLGLTYDWFLGQNNFFFPVFDQQFLVAVPLRFDNLGSGLGGVFGFKAGLALNRSLDLEGKIRYVTNYASSTENQLVPVVNTGSEANVTNTYTMSLSNLNIAAMLHYALSDDWYAAGGVSYSGLLSNSFSAMQTLPTGLFYVDTFGNLTNGISETVPKQSATGLFDASRFDLQLGAGTVIPLSSNSFALDAELLVSVPFTSWLASSKQANFDAFADAVNEIRQKFGDNFPVAHPTIPNLWYASLTIGIRFPFGHSEEEPPAYESNEVPGTPAHGIGDDGKVALSGTVTDSKTGDPVDATMTVVDLTNNQVVATDQTHDGKYNVRVKAPGRYSVTADADGYLFGTAYFQVDNQGRILARDNNIKLSGTSGGRTRLLVFFNSNSATLNASSYPELNRAVHLMKAVPAMKVQIAGYTDSVGSDEYNKQLSQRRAESVRNYLIQNGIAANRITAHGYGKESPIADNGTDDGRAENRRVEFVVLTK